MMAAVARGETGEENKAPVLTVSSKFNLTVSLLTQLDNMGDGDLEALRAQRMNEMKKRQDKTKEWLARGHGEYTEIPTEQDFFKAMKVMATHVCG
jgi:hypothetical protein